MPSIHYGGNAGAVLAFCRTMADAGLDRYRYTEAELRYLVRREHRRTLADLLQRRTSLAITGALSSVAISQAARNPRRGTRLVARQIRAAGAAISADASPDDHGLTPGDSRSTRPEHRSLAMRISPKARMQRLFTNGRCLDVAIDHGVCNEPSFMVGLEDIGGVVEQLVAAGPDAIQMNYGQADLLQARPRRTSRRW